MTKTVGRYVRFAVVFSSVHGAGLLRRILLLWLPQSTALAHQHHPQLPICLVLIDIWKVVMKRVGRYVQFLSWFLPLFQHYLGAIYCSYSPTLLSGQFPLETALDMSNSG